jgi:hypothetical protein
MSWAEIDKHLMTRDSTKVAPKGILFGEIGVGKTTELAKCFPDYLWILTSPTALRAFDQTCGTDTGPAARLWLKDKRSLEDTEIAERGTPSVDYFKWTQQFLANWTKSHRDGSNTYPGLVISEASELFSWIDRDAKRERGRSWGTVDRVKDIIRWFLNAADESETGLIFEMHGRGPKYGTDAAGESTGKITSPGGPGFPISTQVKDVCKNLDFVWEMTAENVDDALSRYLLTTSEYVPSRDGANELKILRKTRGKEQTRRELPLRQQLLDLKFRL